jgi:hypothetical protein
MLGLLAARNSKPNSPTQLSGLRGLVGSLMDTRRRDQKTQMLSTGPGSGVIIDTTYGYNILGFPDNTFCYLNRPMYIGKWYWEARGVSSSWILYGITGAPYSPDNFGGYSIRNSGYYSSGGTMWSDGSWGGSWVGTPEAVTQSDVLGFAYDADGRTFSILKNNAPMSSITYTTPPSPMFAMFAGQSSPDQKIQIGSPGTTFAAPQGFSYL